MSRLPSLAQPPRIPKDLRQKLDHCLHHPQRILFLDIETTGLSHYYDEITVVGWSLGGRAHILIKGDDPSPLLDAAARASALVTFNGIRFDARFLRQEFPQIRLPELHIDLMYLLRRVGLKGGQKAIERELALNFRDGLADVDGFAAVLLWHRYLRGDPEALQRLIRYNRADIAAMGALFDEAVDRFGFQANLFLPSGPKFQLWSVAEGWEPPAPDSLPTPSLRPHSFRSLFVGTVGEGARIVGIDLTGSEAKASGWCLLDGNQATTQLLKTDAQLIEATVAAKPNLVSIDSPLSLPAGRISVTDDDPGRSEFGIMRWCERELKRRGINVYPCLLPSMQKLTARGIRLATELRRRGVPVIESYPGAAQDIMRIPRKGAGQEWLSLGLAEFGISGSWQDATVSHDELDAITSALVGTFHFAGKSEALGTSSEDPLIIPTLNPEVKPFVVGVSGHIGAGKTTFARLLESQGFAYTRFSLVIDDLLREQGKHRTRGNRQRLGEELNQSGRQRWLAEQTLARAGDASRIVVDGLRFPEDHAFLAEQFGANFLHVHIEANAAKRALRSPDALTSETAPVEQGVTLLRDLARLQVTNDADIDTLKYQAEAVARLSGG